MKQAGISKRSRGRSSERSKMSNRNFEFQTHDNKSRGNPQQATEKYLLLARDAASAGDRIAAEGFYQHADHFYRMAQASRQFKSSQNKTRPETEPVAETSPVSQGDILLGDNTPISQDDVIVTELSANEVSEGIAVH